MGYRNGKLKPMYDHDKRFLFWENDTKDTFNKESALSVYRYFDLSCYWHESMRGYHFYSLEPIPIDIWKYAIKMLRPLNLDYPPITLRLKPNKYVGENKLFKIGGIEFYGNHDIGMDLAQFKFWLEHGMIGLISKKYYVITYPMDNNDVTHDLTLKEREHEFEKQIEDSEIE